MTDLLKQFLVAALTMGVIDLFWLGTVAKKFYHSQIGPLLLDKPNVPAAFAFYIIYIVGIIAFVITPAVEKNSLAHAIKFGALFGFVAYATYDLTNLATLKGFTTKLVAVDLIWGALLTATVSAVTFLVFTKWLS